jgi:hypothetical protein
MAGGVTSSPPHKPGFFEAMGQAGIAGGFEKLTKQKMAILAEAERSGARPLAVWDSGQYEHRATSARWQALTVGSLQATSMQTFVFETNGMRHLFVQPYASSDPLPGTHHVWIRGATRSPVLFDAAQSMFHAGHDVQLAHWLVQAPIGQLLRALDWDYRIGPSTRIEDPVALQARAMGDGLAHVAIRAVRENTFDNHDVGFMNVWRIAHALAMSGLEPVTDRHPFLGAEPPGTSVFADLLAGSLELPSPGPVIDLTSAIVPLLQSLGSKTMLVVPPISPKRDKGARSPEGMIPPWLHAQPILALHDKTVFGGGTRGVAILPTHLCYTSDDTRFVVSYGDITGAHHMIGTLAVRSRMVGDVVFDFPESEPFAALFDHVARQSSPS